MKSLLTLAALTAFANALSLETDTEVDSATETIAAVDTEEGYSGPIVPADFGYAVRDFDLAQPFTDQECYQKQVDIYSD